MLTKDLLNILACPACRGELKASCNEQKLLCRTCGRAFPVREGIPVMLMDEAEVFQQLEIKDVLPC